MDAFEKKNRRMPPLLRLERIWNQISQTKTKAKRITKEAKEKLRQFFEEKGWPRYRTLPKKNGNSQVDKIINDLGLERSQVARQLAQWKKDTYDKAQLQLLTKPDSIVESMHALSMIRTQ